MTGSQVGTHRGEIDVALGPVLTGLDLSCVGEGVGVDGDHLAAVVDHAEQNYKAFVYKFESRLIVFN